VTVTRQGLSLNASVETLGAAVACSEKPAAYLNTRGAADIRFTGPTSHDNFMQWHQTREGMPMI
jgi:hypothetical protein